MGQFFTFCKPVPREDVFYSMGLLEAKIKRNWNKNCFPLTRSKSICLFWRPKNKNVFQIFFLAIVLWSNSKVFFKFSERKIISKSLRIKKNKKTLPNSQCSASASFWKLWKVLNHSTLPITVITYTVYCSKNKFCYCFPLFLQMFHLGLDLPRFLWAKCVVRTPSISLRWGTPGRQRESARIHTHKYSYFINFIICRMYIVYK